MRFVLSICAGILAILALSFDTFAQTGTPSIYLKFTEDKVYILDNQRVQFTADVFMGSQEIPANDIYAVAFDVVFDADLVIPASAVFTYHAQSFLGGGNEVEISQKTQGSDKGRLNVVISRQNGKNVSGFGKIGTVSFITSSDIIGGREIEEIPFNGRVEPLKLLNASGRELPFESDADGDSTILINDILAQDARNTARNIEVYPNPARDRVYVHLRNLHGEYVEVFNAQGQRVSIEPIRLDYIQLATDSFQPGIYLIRIRAEEGILTKRVLISR